MKMEADCCILLEERLPIAPYFTVTREMLYIPCLNVCAMVIPKRLFKCGVNHKYDMVAFVVFFVVIFILLCLIDITGMLLIITKLFD